jgi:sugar phosphate permease
LALLVLSIFINFIDRANLSVAAEDLRRELMLRPSQLGLLLSAFFWTYAAFQLVAGWLVDRYNVFWVYGIGFFVWSLATGLTGTVTGFAMLFA